MSDTNNRESIPDVFPFRHRMKVQIRFNDIDTLGHVNNAVCFTYFDLGKAKYFETVLGGNVDWGNVNVVIANVNCNFFAPVFFNEPIEVITKTRCIHRSSFELVQQIVDAETGDVKSECRTIMVGFDVKLQRSAPLEVEWIEALNNFEQRNLQQL